MHSYHRYYLIAILLYAPVVLSASPTTFDLMQIEQLIGGINGDVTAQAIQLRMRANFQGSVSLARLQAWDATGSNPVLIIDFTTNVANGDTGARVLVASTNFVNSTNPAVNPDFSMTNLIPMSYLAAGSLTFEDDAGTILWRISWGGASYTGSTMGIALNDADGEFGPPFDGALPTTDTQALLFPGAANALSTNNAADYVLTGGAAVFTNNAGESSTVVSVEAIGGEVPMEYALQQNYPNPFNPSTIIEFSVPRSNYVTLKVYDTLGEEVATLVSENFSAGRYEVQWDGSRFASGVYFYRLSVVPEAPRDLVPTSRDGQAREFVETKKLVLMK